MSFMMPYGVRAVQKQRGAIIAIGCNRNIKHRRFKHGRDVQTKMLSLMHTTSAYNLKVRTAEQGLPSANVNVFLRFHRKGNARSARGDQRERPGQNWCYPLSLLGWFPLARFFQPVPGVVAKEKQAALFTTPVLPVGTQLQNCQLCELWLKHFT